MYNTTLLVGLVVCTGYYIVGRVVRRQDYIEECWAHTDG